MKNTKIVFLKQNNYYKQELEKKIRHIFKKTELFNELKEKKVHSVLLKPNLLGIYPPELAVDTHPIFVETVAMILKKNGYIVGVGDSSASFYKMERLFTESGYAPIFEKKYAVMENFELEPFTEITLENQKIKKIMIAGALKKYDYVISLPKLKTHNISLITCALKNYYGIIPGIRKTQYHHIFHRFKDFNRFLIDLYAKIRPDFYLVDGILGMDGDGPAGGNPRHLDLMIGGRDGLKIDGYLLKMMGVNAEKLDYFQYAEKKGLYSSVGRNDLDIPFDFDFMFKDFKLPIASRLSMFTNILPKFMFGFLRVKPIIDKKKCILCQACIKKCPEKAMKLTGKMVKIDYNKCIACGCCKEVCPVDAIHIKGNIPMKVLSIGRNIYEKIRSKKGK